MKRKKQSDIKDHGKKRKRGKAFAFAWIFGCISLVLSVCLIFAIMVAVKLRRNNMFSRNILIDNNYFMANGVTEYGEISADFEEEKDPDSVYAEVSELEDGAVYIDRDTDEWYVYREIALETIDYLNDEYGMDISENNGMINEITGIYFIYGATAEGDREVEDYLYGMLGERYDLRGIRDGDSVTLDIPYISQEGILPNGCEAVSATMLLQNLGFEISPEDFVDGYLDMKPVSIRWGCRYGPNPKYFYAGDPRSEKEGWGCFAPVIVKALDKYLPEEYSVKNTTGLSLNTLKEEYVSNGIPVAVWVTVDMGEVDRVLQWQSEDREETFLYPANEHCMVLVGFDSENYIFADPYKSRGVVSYPIDDCVLAFNSLGMQSVVIVKE